MKIIQYIMPAALIAFASCSASKTTTATASYTYAKDVKTIIDGNCASSCHSADDPAAGISLVTYEQVKEQALNGKLLPAIQHLEGAEAMPKKNPKLDDASIQAILAWASAGALE
jgi:mono/diheme cytochrome c family protein